MTSWVLLFASLWGNSASYGSIPGFTSKEACTSQIENVQKIDRAKAICIEVK